MGYADFISMLARFGLDLSETTILILFAIYIILANRKRIAGLLSGTDDKAELVEELRRLAIPAILKVYGASEAAADENGGRLRGAEKRELVRQMYSELGQMMAVRHDPSFIYEQVTEQGWSDIVEEEFERLTRG